MAGVLAIEVASAICTSVGLRTSQCNTRRPLGEWLEEGLQHDFCPLTGDVSGRAVELGHPEKGEHPAPHTPSPRFQSAHRLLLELSDPQGRPRGAFFLRTRLPRPRILYTPPFPPVSRRTRPWGTAATQRNGRGQPAILPV